MNKQGQINYSTRSYLDNFRLAIIPLLGVLLLLQCTSETPPPNTCNFCAHELEEAETIKNANPIQALAIVREVLAHASEHQNKYEEAYGNFILCTLPISTISSHEALAACSKSSAYWYQQDDKRKLAILNNFIGIHNDIIGQKKNAVKAFQTSEEYFLALNDEYWLGELYNNWGVVYAETPSINNTLNLYLKALEYNEKSQNLSGLMASYVNIGKVYHRQQLYHAAAEQFNKCIALAKKTNDRFWEAMALAFLADVHDVKGQTEKAKQTYLESLTITQNTNNDYTSIHCLNQLAAIHIRQQEYENALSILDESYVKIKRSGKRKALENVYCLNAQAYLGLDQPPKAKEMIEKGLGLVNESGNREVKVELLKTQSDYYAQLGAFEYALVYKRQHGNLKDSLFGDANKQLIETLEATLQTNEKQKEIFRLKEANLNQSKFLTIALFVILLILIVLVIIFIYYQQKRTYNLELENQIEAKTQELTQSNTELQRFAYIASHDLKTPLRTISSFATLIKRKVKKHQDAEIEELLEYVSNGASQMHMLVEDVLEYSKLSNQSLSLKQVDLNQTLKNIHRNLQELIARKKVVIEADTLPIIQGNPSQLLQLFQNLIVNGIKYNLSDRPTIKINFREHSDHYQFSILDNGIGIAPSHQATIFEMFKRLHPQEQYQGSGIGLALCKKIVDQHQGKIWVESAVNQGSTFSFTISKNLVED